MALENISNKQKEAVIAMINAIAKNTTPSTSTETAIGNIADSLDSGEGNDNIAASVAAIADNLAAPTEGNSIATSLQSIASSLATIAQLLNPLYTAEYEAPEETEPASEEEPPANDNPGEA